MSIPDIINGLFESGGALLSWFNVKKLLKDKRIQGVYWPITAFWSLWGAWNLFYYPSLHQPCSFYGGALLFAGNTVWVVLAIYFRWQEQEAKGYCRVAKMQ